MSLSEKYRETLYFPHLTLSYRFTQLSQQRKQLQKEQRENHTVSGVHRTSPRLGKLDFHTKPELKINKKSLIQSRLTSGSSSSGKPKSSSTNHGLERGKKPTSTIPSQSKNKSIQDRLGKTVHERLGKTVLERLGNPAPKGSLVLGSGIMLGPRSSKNNNSSKDTNNSGKVGKKIQRR